MRGSEKLVRLHPRLTQQLSEEMKVKSNFRSAINNNRETNLLALDGR
jgi:hypothetical protein